MKLANAQAVGWVFFDPKNTKPDKREEYERLYTPINPLEEAKRAIQDLDTIEKSGVLVDAKYKVSLIADPQRLHKFDHYIR